LVRREGRKGRQRKKDKTEGRKLEGEEGEERKAGERWDRMGNGMEWVVTGKESERVV